MSACDTYLTHHIHLGWFGFNCVSTLALWGLGETAGKVATVTMMSSASAGLSCLLIGKLYTKQLELAWCMNGILAGLVAITPACAVVEPYSALVIGCKCYCIICVTQY
jgi:Amt family ammonium transporter